MKMMLVTAGLTIVIDCKEWSGGVCGVVCLGYRERDREREISNKIRRLKTLLLNINSLKKVK